MSTAKNYLYNVSYQIIIIILPIITVPYISRILGAEGIGINAYTNSIIQYFILFGTIGISLYATRIIAFYRDDKKKLSTTFWSIFYLKLFTTLISYLIFIAFIFIFDIENKNIFLIQSINILNAAIDISWLFIGIEDFKRNVTRNFIVKVISIILIFILIKIKQDLWKYVFINSLSGIVGQLLLWKYAFKIINKEKITFFDIKKHIIPSLKYFLPQIAIQVYVVLDKTMIGLLTNKCEVGFYENADKIVKMALTLVTSVGAVMMPKITNIYASGDFEKIKQYLKKSFDFECYLSIPIMFGLMGISKEFCPWFFGFEFLKTANVIIIISPIIIAIAWSNVLAGQYLIPIGRINQYTISVTLGAITNFILNSFLIPKYASIGAAFATVIAEFVVTGTEIIFIRKDIDLFYFMKDFWKYFLSSLIMYIFVRLIGVYNGINILTTLLQIIIGVLCYFTMLFILKSDMHIYLIKMIKDKCKIVGVEKL
ncbi:Membrane protein involved in the export of O-antigen and teichoic acid [Caloramator quimbayensis]|uniref:Membrane protein involved in the export of O-antigen and teichoic acid n=1 Tax=Caloramator quimbayensis TaxID=1147123 RepID=A0A1T4XG68_9CLOT|nr:flippase [Caloramator quimbayensis]SKA88572.1 Membrane protein involved in the export of O-antigen and teichoic acid [Caloramator quimbayensis]